MPTAPPNHTAATPMPPQAKPGRSRYHPGSPTAAPGRRRSPPGRSRPRPAACHPGAGHGGHAGLGQVDGEELPLLAHARADQGVVEHSGERAPVLAPVEDVRRPGGRGAQRFARPLGGEHSPGPALHRCARLVEDRERVEVGLEGPRHREVGGGDAGQRRPQVEGATSAGQRQPGTHRVGEREGGGHVARRHPRLQDEVGEVAALVERGGPEQDRTRVVADRLRHGRRGPSAAARRTGRGTRTRRPRT